MNTAIKYTTSRYTSSQGEPAPDIALHAVDTDAEELFTYVPQLESWSRSQHIEDHYFFPEIHQDEGQITFEDTTLEEARKTHPDLTPFTAKTPTN